MFENFNLIKESENQELFDYQNKIIENISSEPKELLTLAILQTLSPIENFNVAMEILKYAQNIIEDERVSLIGFYLSVKWNGETSDFFEKMLYYYNICDSEYKSMVNYLLALQAQNDNNNTKIIMLLKQSITQWQNHVNNYLLFAKYGNEKHAKYYLDKAKKNIVSTNDMMSLTVEYFANPDNFVGEFISGKFMPVETFESMCNLIKNKNQ